MEYELNKNVKEYDEDITLPMLEKLVKEEADYIKNNIPQEYVSKLEGKLKQINGEMHNECIYGTMFGSCFNDLAHKHIFNVPSIIQDQMSAPRTFMTPIEFYISPQSFENTEEVQNELEIYFNPEEYDEEEYDEEIVNNYLKRVEKVLSLILN